MAPSPKRMADYFFIVGLHDNYSLFDDSFADQREICSPIKLGEPHFGNHTTTTTAPTTKPTTAATEASAQADRSPATHSSISHGDTIHSSDMTPSPPSSTFSSPAQAHTPVRTHTRSRSKSVAQFNHIDQSLPDHFHKQNGPMLPQRSKDL
jgi:hypothetical protein